MIWTTRTKPGCLGAYHGAKCASRSLLGYLVLIDDPGLYEAHPEWFRGVRHSSEGEYGPLRARVAMMAPRHDWMGAMATVPARGEHRICIVRDPVERFVSGYRNRVLFHGDLKGTHGEVPPSLEAFVEGFESYCRANRHIWGHFLPQCAFYGSEPEMLTEVFGVEEVGTRLRAYLEGLFHVELPALHLQQSGEQVPGLVLEPSLRRKIENLERVAMDIDVWGPVHERIRKEMKQ